MFVDQESLKQLGWVQILRVVEESIQTERGRTSIAQLTPSSKIDEVEWRLAIQSELHWLSETESLTLELDGAKEVGPLVRRAEKAVYLKGSKSASVLGSSIPFKRRDRWVSVGQRTCLT